MISEWIKNTQHWMLPTYMYKIANYLQMDRQKNIKRPPNGACIFKAINILQVLDRGAKKSHCMMKQEFLFAKINIL